MKENYQYNSKNVEIKDKIILPEVQMSKQDLELIASSAKRVFTNLNQLLSKTEFKSTILIFALSFTYRSTFIFAIFPTTITVLPAKSITTLLF